MFARLQPDLDWVALSNPDLKRDYDFEVDWGFFPKSSALQKHESPSANVLLVSIDTRNFVQATLF